MNKISELISKYNLEKHPEGGYFSETYRSEQVVSSPVNSQERAAVTDIYFLLPQGEVSRFHKVLHDELWHFYEGAPLQLVKYNGHDVSEQVIGPDAQGGYKVIVEGGVYQAAVSLGEYTLVGCTVAPGFDFADFSFLADCPEEKRKFETEFEAYQHLL